MEKKRALILYATMTRNTEKVAVWFKEAFEAYNWDVTLFKLAVNSDWEGMQKNLYFDDYDFVCLGSPIVGGGPLQIVTRVLSLGGGGALEGNIESDLDEGRENYDLEKDQQTHADIKKGSKGRQVGANWRRSMAPYRGIMNYEAKRPIGLVFTTYGGGFFGTGEATATLELMKLYLQLKEVDVMGKFSCCGKEFGPAGLKPGEKPEIMPNPDGTPRDEMPDPAVYTLANGEERYGSFFHHHAMWDKPGEREEMKAKAIICDMVEDYFMTNDGKRRPATSEYLSIS